MSTQTQSFGLGSFDDDPLSLEEIQTLRFLNNFSSRKSLKEITSKVKGSNLGILNNLCTKGLVDPKSNLYILTEAGEEAVLELDKLKIKTQ